VYILIERTIFYSNFHINHLTLNVLQRRRAVSPLQLLLALELTVGWNINTGLWSKLWFFTRNFVTGVLYP